jgi:hypothetical protein
MKKPHVDIGRVGPSTCHMVSEVLSNKTTQLLLHRLQVWKCRSGIDKDKSLMVYSWIYDSSLKQEQGSIMLLS